MQAGHPLELADVMCDEWKTVLQGSGCDQNVHGTNWMTSLLESGADASSMRGSVSGEWKDLDLFQQKQDFTALLFPPFGRTTFHPVEQLVSGNS